jgi:hypothetical protein
MEIAGNGEYRQQLELSVTRKRQASKMQAKEKSGEEFAGRTATDFRYLIFSC